MTLLTSVGLSGGAFYFFDVNDVEMDFRLLKSLGRSWGRRCLAGAGGREESSDHIEKNVI